MPSLPPVLIELRASATEFMAKMDEAEKHVQNLGQKGATTGEQLRQHVGMGMVAVGTAATAAGAVLLEMGEKVERSHVDLETAVKNTGASYDEFAGQVNKAVSKQERFGHSSGDTQEALAVLTRATGNTSQSLKDMALVTEIAAAHHTSLAAAADTVARMHAGAYKSLKEFGINVQDNAKAVAELNKAQNEANKTDDARSAAMRKLQDLETIQHSKANLTVADHIALRNAQMAATDADLKNEAAQKRLEEASKSGAKAMDFNTASALVMAKVHGTAEAQADTFGGKITALKTHLEDMAASLGQKVGPALTIAGPLLAGLGGIVTAVVDPAFLAMAGSVITAIAPFVAIAAAIAALTVGVIYAYNHFQVFHDTVDAVASFFKDTVWPIIQQVASGIASAVGAMVDFIRDHWSQIMAIVRPVLDAVKTYVETVMTVISDVIKFVMAVIHGDWGAAWNAIKDAASAVWDGIKTIIGDGLKLVVQILKDAVPLLLDGGKKLLEAMWHGIQAAWDDGVQFFKDLPGHIWDAVVAGGKKLTELGSKLVKLIIESVKIDWELAKSFFSDLPQHIVDAVVAGAEKLVDLGKTIVKKIVEGITSVGGSILSAITDHIPGGGAVAGALSHLPGLASGGVVKARPGGTLALVGEGNRDEAVVPLNPDGSIPGGSAGDTYNITVNGRFDNPQEAARAVVLQLRLAG